jgi:hypothetical protein
MEERMLTRLRWESSGRRECGVLGRSSFVAKLVRMKMRIRYKSGNQYRLERKVGKGQRKK